MTVRSDCPTCDATVTAMGITRSYHWTGTGWTGTTKGDCGTGTITPTCGGRRHRPGGVDTSFRVRHRIHSGHDDTRRGLINR